MSRNTLASALTLTLMAVTAVSYDFVRGSPLASFLFIILFGPISFLLWRGQNLRDCSAAELVKFCGKAMVASLGLGIALAGILLVGDSLNHQRTTTAQLEGVLSIFVVVAGLVPFFVILSLVRLSIKRLLVRLMADSTGGVVSGWAPLRAAVERPDLTLGNRKFAPWFGIRTAAIFRDEELRLDLEVLTAKSSK